MCFKLSKHTEKLNKVFKETLETESEFYIWGNQELLKRFNEKLNSHLKLNTTQLRLFLYRFQKHYRIFKHRKSTGSTSYIFIKARRNGNES